MLTSGTVYALTMDDSWALGLLAVIITITSLFDMNAKAELVLASNHYHGITDKTRDRRFGSFSGGKIINVYPCVCSFSSSLSPSMPQVSWSSSSRLCWLAADSLSSAITDGEKGSNGIVQLTAQH